MTSPSDAPGMTERCPQCGCFALRPVLPWVPHWFHGGGVGVVMVQAENDRQPSARCDLCGYEDKGGLIDDLPF